MDNYQPNTTLNARDRYTGALLTYPMKYSSGYAFHMTTNNGRGWTCITTVKNMLEIYDADLPYQAWKAKEKWRIVRVSDGKVLRTNVIPPCEYLTSEERSRVYTQKRRVASPWAD